jgi:hypothetical protein
MLLRTIMSLFFLAVISSAAFADTPSELKVYNNATYNVEVQYPADFQAVEGRDEYWKFEYVTFKPVDTAITGSVSISFNGPQVGSYSLLDFFDTPAYASPPPYRNLGKMTIGGIQGVHEVMEFGTGEIHIVRITKDALKMDLSAKWGYVSDMPSAQPLPDYTNDKAVIMDAFAIITSSLQVKSQDTITADQCASLGGEIINTLTQKSCEKESGFLGTVAGMRCPCMCCKKQ